MNNETSLISLSTQQLVDLFEQISLAYAEAAETFQTGRANGLYAKRRAVLSEMRHRKQDERVALFALYDHRHPQVRLNVATSTYALNPEKAREVMIEVANSKIYPYAADAGMHLRGLEDRTSAILRDFE